MDREIIRLWSGPIEDIPKEYAKDGIPEGCINVTIYSDGSRIYDKGFTLSKAFRDRINFRMGKCWDSLSRKEQESINSELESAGGEQKTAGMERERDGGEQV